IAAGKEEQEPQDREIPPKHRRVPPRGCGARSTPGRFTAAAGPPAAHETKTFPFGWKGISREGSGFLRAVWAGTAHARPPRRPMPENRSSAGRGPGSLAGGHALARSAVVRQGGGMGLRDGDGSAEVLAEEADHPLVEAAQGLRLVDHVGESGEREKLVVDPGTEEGVGDLERLREVDVVVGGAVEIGRASCR